jgi:hypothetical protein
LYLFPSFNAVPYSQKNRTKGISTDFKKELGRCMQHATSLGGANKSPVCRSC